MWRGYGNRGGYALVFETQALSRCFKAEWDSYEYTVLKLGSVVYSNEVEKRNQEFGDLRIAIEKFLIGRNSPENVALTGAMFSPFFNAVTRLKHRGFQEEQEVRLIASPVSNALAKRIERDGEKLKKPLKPISFREGSGAVVPYLAVNDVQNRSPLPVKKIIIGPHQNQAERLNGLKRFVARLGIEVTCSETPYLPPIH